jgi:hypothetical protein
VVGDARQDRAQVGFGIEAVQFGRPQQAIEGSGSFPTGVGAREELVATAHGDSEFHRFFRAGYTLSRDHTHGTSAEGLSPARH